MKKRVFVGMSGGVDSSVAAMLLHDAGHEVVGVFMRCYNVDGCAERDAEDARRVAEQLGIHFYVWNFEKEYKRRVVEYMVEGYRSGITPNPDVACNKEIKFGLFLERALAAGADRVATGHYVRLKEDGGVYSLWEAKDQSKDQSYFLWTLGQKELAQCLFPLGSFLKTEVRDIARRRGLLTAEKKDSQGICFLGQISMGDFLERYIPKRRGAIVTTGGEMIGEHFGAAFYTIGQRHLAANFVFPKTGGSAPRRAFYVAAKDASRNIVTVAEGSENPALYRSEARIAGVHWIGGGGSKEPMTELAVRVRYRQPLAPATLIPDAAGKATLHFRKPQKFIASGQSAVWYSNEGEMLGGGVIE